MAKFRNIDKRRRPWETKEQKRRRSFWEAGILQHRTNMMLAKYGFKPMVQSQTEQTDSGDSLEEYYSAHPIMAVRPPAAPTKRMCALDPPVLVDDGDVQPLGAASIDGSLLVERFSLMFFRLRQWFRDLWAAARFTHPAAWLLVSRHRAKPS